MEMLNSEGDNGLWWGGKSGIMYYYPLDGSSKTITVDFSGDEYKMESDVLNMISNSRYYLAGHDVSNIATTAMYIYERTNTGCNNGRYDTSRPYYWDGKVALMYPSDYGYSAGEACATKTDLFEYYNGCGNTFLLIFYGGEWILSPDSRTSHYSFDINGSGMVNTVRYRYTYLGRSVRPVFYLTPDVIITGGTGEESNPYQVSR